MRRLSYKVKQLCACFVVLFLVYYIFLCPKENDTSTRRDAGVEPKDSLLPHARVPQRPIQQSHINVKDIVHRHGYVSLNVKERRAVPTCSRANNQGHILSTPISAREQIFQPVFPDTNPKEVYVYSAYYQIPLPGTSESRRIRMVGIVRSSSGAGARLLCQIWYRVDSHVMLASPAHITPIKCDGAHSYCSAYVDCNVNADVTEVPFAVSLVARECDEPQNMLSVVDNSGSLDTSSSNNPSNFAVVCPGPLNLLYNHVDQIVEWMEVNRLLGASHFLFYNYSVGPNVTKVLQYYVEQGIATVLQWPVPVKVHVWPIPSGYREDIAYFAQAGQLADCILKSATRFRFSVLADLDEYLLPRRHLSWRELMTAIAPNETPSSVMFRNVFFKTEWPSDSRYSQNSIEKLLNLTTLLKTRRETEIHPPGQRSKVIVNPLDVDTMEVHEVLRYRRSGRVHLLSPEDGLVHHYRNWEGMGSQQFVVDTSMHRLEKDIISSVAKAKKAMNIPHR